MPVLHKIVPLLLAAFAMLAAAAYAEDATLNTTGPWIKHCEAHPAMLGKNGDCRKVIFGYYLFISLGDARDGRQTICIKGRDDKDYDSRIRHIMAWLKRQPPDGQASEAIVAAFHALYPCR